ncbi:hypothetical protein QAD02_004582 [Eretmocerus hayati]|uniref:Uncharacterized protein n=1 Tax=Eretmocerus hayati TaxID=131215 RepID=A0ACC2NUT7_9HYME|nr:hypothetical protein QAD02_004582 [Eretmocerus hayati]
MSDLDIPIIEPSVDYTKVPPISQKRTIAFINHFIIQTITFLNKFALSCEEKLFEFENKIQRVEASLAILEARLSSIPELKDHNPVPVNDTQIITKEEPVAPEPNVVVDDHDEPDQIPEIPQTEETDTYPVSQDPSYAKYFKMVHVGVPKQAVKLKMEQEGLDSSMLETPQKLIPKPKVDDMNE